MKLYCVSLDRQKVIFSQARQLISYAKHAHDTHIDHLFSIQLFRVNMNFIIYGTE